MATKDLVPFPGKPLALRTQLAGQATQGEDCGPCTCANGIRHASQGLVGPRSQREMKTWMKLIRNWADVENRPLRLSDCLRAYRHPDLRERFAKAGLTRLRASLYRGADWWTLDEHLKAGKFLHMPVSYRIINENEPRPPSGDPNFNDDHFLCVAGYQMRGGLIWTNEGDPLFDGRRSSIPNGWQPIRFRWLREPAGKFGSVPWGVGRAEFITVKVSGRA